MFLFIASSVEQPSLTLSLLSLQIGCVHFSFKGRLMSYGFFIFMNRNSRMQTVQTLIRHSALRCLIWDCTVCQGPIYVRLGKNWLSFTFFLGGSGGFSSFFSSSVFSSDSSFSSSLSFPESSFSLIKWATPWENVSYVICEQQKHRSACASMQSDQHLCCSLLR